MKKRPEKEAPPDPEPAAAKPHRHSAKVRVTLPPELAAADAVKLVLRHLFDTLRDNEQGAREGADPERLHDFRVSVRRTRTALGQLRRVFRRRDVDRFRRAFAWLGAVTTPARDLDVHVLSFPAHRRALPPRARRDLGPLLDLLRTRQAQAHAALAEVLASKRYRKLLRVWSEALAPEGLRASRVGRKPVRQVADRRLRKVFRRTLREGRALGEGSPAEAFHELRKTCKKLRYVMEFFQSLYPPGALRPFVAALKGLQDNLGELQDLHVQAAALTEWAGELAAADSPPARTLAALDLWAERLSACREEARGEFAEAFGRFADPENAARFEALLRRDDGRDEGREEEP